MTALTSRKRGDTSRLAPAASRSRSERARRYPVRDIAVVVSFLLPSVLIFAAFIFYPMYRTLYLSLHANDVIGRPTTFVGLTQFRAVLTSPEFGHVVLVTAIFTVITVIPACLLGLLLALALQRRLAGIGIFRTLFATPFAFSAATASVVFAVCFNPAIGIFNGLLHRLGTPPVAWLTSTTWALVSVAMVSVWMQLGYNVLILSAGLQSIPDDVYEAARIDGSDGWNILRRITLPLLGPSLFLVIVTSTISSLQTFGQIHILTQGGPTSATTTLVYSVYQNAFAFGSSNFGLASAQAVVLCVVMALATIGQFRLLGGRVFYQ